MSKLIYILLFISLSLVSCNNSDFSVEIPKNNFQGLWLITSVEGPFKKDAALPAMIKFNTGRWIQFNTDSTYTTNIKGQYDYGTYSPFKDGKDSVLLRSFRGDIYHLSAKYDGNGNGKILHRITIPDMSAMYDYKFDSRVRQFDFDEEKIDPYSKENNLWRMPAERSENDSLLAIRMINHIDFWIAYLNLANKMETKTLNLNNINTCFEFSNYGIIMNRFNDWESTFKTLFYNRAEAERAYNLTTQAIYRCKYEKDENAYSQGIKLFKQIRLQLQFPDGRYTVDQK